MPDIIEELAHLVHKGRAAAFAIELDQLAEEGKTPTLEAHTFRNLTINKFNFRGLDLTNVAFENCTLSECTFESCNLEGTFLDNVTLSDCTWRDCHGEGFAMDVCTIARTTFEGMRLEAPEWNDVQWSEGTLGSAGRALELSESLLERITLREVVLAGVEIDGGELKHVTLRGVDGLGRFVVSEETETHACYVVGGDEDALPTGFARKSGKRRTL